VEPDGRHHRRHSCRAGLRSMSARARIRSWPRSIVRRSRLERETDDELLFHLEERSGMLAASPSAWLRHMPCPGFSAGSSRECRARIRHLWRRQTNRFWRPHADYNPCTRGTRVDEAPHVDDVRRRRNRFHRPSRDSRRKRLAEAATSELSCLERERQTRVRTDSDPASSLKLERSGSCSTAALVYDAVMATADPARHGQARHHASSLGSHVRISCGLPGTFGASIRRHAAV
jgi:hypothetical protein